MKNKYDKDIKKIEILEKIAEFFLVFVASMIVVFIAVYQGNVEYKHERWIFIIIGSMISTVLYYVFKGIKRDDNKN